ncbi:flagellar hook-associated protein FlgK [Bacillus suaedae]|uniref:Flagellar hook-associated protein 1 n=1 Tax=Halalkalibacter suaedae TaxID=2822140 RepID=A0A940WXG5_9BACI|nr:flagellar hook-associated protein FlgK [Bacillus suaedae]MBP3950040.1 flagellar hook-associated protein FlgK [Bacillus suaedae]
MQSTFHGLETARRAMMTQQSALHTTGHNIANANTEGYSRQRVNFKTTEPYPGVGLNAPKMPGQIGTGVKADSIQRVRDQFLDIQYRNENNKQAYWDSRHVSLEKMEDILNEPSEEGLNNQINLFWTSLQDLTVDPEDSGARSVVRQRAVAVAETFNYMHDSLATIQNDYKNEINVTNAEVNSLLSQLDSINAQVRAVEPNGYVTNDLYDQQDSILGQLSRIINIKADREKSGGNANPSAEGAVTVTLIDDAGQPYMNQLTGQPLKLVDGTGAAAYKELSMEFANDQTAVNKFAFVDSEPTVVVDANGNTTNQVNEYTIDLEKMPRGEMKALVEAHGYLDASNQVKGVFPDILKELNGIAEVFATEMNNVHNIGFTLPNSNGEVKIGGDLFDLSAVTAGVGAAKAIKLDATVRASLDNIAAAGVSIDQIVSEEKKQEYKDLLAASPRDYAQIQAFLNESDPANPDYKVNFINGNWAAFSGDGSNAKRLADIKDTSLQFNNDTGTISSYYQGVIGDMAVNTQEALRMTNSSEALKESIDFRRQSVSNVSVDEEMTMMIQYQHAYNAAARNITMVDEMLDRIINNMGVVGR